MLHGCRGNTWDDKYYTTSEYLYSLSERLQKYYKTSEYLYSLSERLQQNSYVGSKVFFQKNIFLKIVYFLTGKILWNETNGNDITVGK